MQPWRREGSGRMDRTERALGTGGAGLRGAAEARGRGPPLLTAKGRGPRRDEVCAQVSDGSRPVHLRSPEASTARGVVRDTLAPRYSMRQAFLRHLQNLGPGSP